MKKFDYKNESKKLLTPEIVALLTKIHEYKGEQRLFIEANSDKLVELLEIAKIQSIDASNKIEGIYTSDERLKKLVLDKTTPRTRNEQEIAGYRDVLKTIHENYDFITIRPNMILQLHHDLYKHNGEDEGGKYKSSDNVIAEEDANGIKHVRFIPAQAWQTPDYIEQLCDEFNEAMAQSNIDSLLLISMFILDFLSIYPFKDGNGRMSRLLTLLLLYKTGYIVGKYISIEKVIEKTKETYYEALYDSSVNWHEGTNDYEPFVRYMLGIIVSTYRDFAQRVQLITSISSKSERIKEIIKNHIGKITKSEIMELCPDISQITVQRTLIDLVNKKEIIKIGGGRYTSYVYNTEDK